MIITIIRVGIIAEMLLLLLLHVEILQLVEVGGEGEVQHLNYEKRRRRNHHHYHLYDDHFLQEQVVGLLLQYDVHCLLELDDDIINNNSIINSSSNNNNNNNLVVIEVSGKDQYHLVEELLESIQLIPTKSAVVLLVAAVRGN
jgi:hypothetical protein